jgi:SAM-dependent methyltransferase
MDEILHHAKLRSFVLDLGSAYGSFASDATPATPVRVDRLMAFARHRELFVQADAVDLPFANSTFSAVIANHSLEHMDDLRGCLKELGRVVRKDGALFISVPDASTFTDRLYRWLANGGGHVNPFRSASDLAALIENASGLPRVATKVLCSSLSFLNGRNSPRPIPKKLLLLGWGSEWSLFLYLWLSRRLDRLTGFRTSVYGWGMYFGYLDSKPDTKAWLNVCLRCGRGCPASDIHRLTGRFSRLIGQLYKCSACGAINPFVEDFFIE